MKVSEMIAKLQEIERTHGDLEIVGGSIHEDRGPEKVIVLDREGCELGWYPEHGSEPMGVFFE